MGNSESAAANEVRTNVQLSRDLFAEKLFSCRVPNTKTVTAQELSWDGRYLAIGDDQGRVTIRDMESLAKRTVVLSSGSDVRITSIVWSRGSSPWGLFVASGNGFLNHVSFHEDLEHEPPRNTGLKCCGLITCMALNDDESQLAVSYDYTTKIYTLPFEEGDPIELGASAGFVVNKPYFSGRQWYRSPVRDHPRAVSIHYLGKHLLCIASFGKLEAYDTDPGTDRNRVWEITVPKTTNIGSCAISPSRKLLAATNLHNGIDWYSLETMEWLSETPIEENYEIKNFILPVRFLTEHTFVAGSNLGHIVFGTYGVVATKPIGKKRYVPSQHLTVFRSSSKAIVVYASGYHVTATFLDLPPTPVGSRVPLIPEVNPTPPQDLVLPRPGQERGAEAEQSASTPAFLGGTKMPPHSTPPPTGDLLGAEFTFEKEPKPQDVTLFRVTSDARPREILSVEAGRNQYDTSDAGTGAFHSFLSPEGLPSQRQEARSAYSPSNMTLSIPSSPLDDKPTFAPVPIALGQPRTRYSTHLLTRQGNSGGSKEVNFAPHKQHAYGGWTRPETPLYDTDIVRSERQAPRRRQKDEAPNVQMATPTDAKFHDDEDEEKEDVVAESPWNTYSNRLWKLMTANPKLTSIALVSVIVTVIALLCSRGGSGKGQSLTFSDVGPRSPNIVQYHTGDDGDEEYADDEDDEGADSRNGDGEYDTVILTETKVLTITRTVTHTATVTTTVTANPKPERSPKPRRRQ